MEIYHTGQGQQFLGLPEHILNKPLEEQGAAPLSYKMFDPAFDQALEAIREFVSCEWDRFIANENKGN